MKKTRRRTTWIQDELFLPRPRQPQRPQWEAIPREVQSKVIQGLAQLLSQVLEAQRSATAATAKEVGDD